MKARVESMQIVADLGIHLANSFLALKLGSYQLQLVC